MAALVNKGPPCRCINAQCHKGFRSFVANTDQYGRSNDTANYRLELSLKLEHVYCDMSMAVTSRVAYGMKGICVPTRFLY